MATVDVCLFNGEADILDIRLNILKDHVDQFIIVEAPITFSGNLKPYYFASIEHKYAHLPIKYHRVDMEDKELWEEAAKSPNTQGADHWKTEFFIKESIKKALNHLEDRDVVFISDCDEIWKPGRLYKGDGIVKLHQKMFVYYLNMRTSEDWYGTLVTKYANIKHACLNHLRTGEHFKMDDGGWHFSSMGGIDEVRRKLNDSYTNESYNTGEVQVKLADRFGKSDYIGRDFKFHIEDPQLPINIQKYANLLYNPVL